MVDNEVDIIEGGSSTRSIGQEEYDPFTSKKAKDPSITNVQAFFLVIQGVVGTGILQAVFVFRQGWIIGLTLTALIGFICTHSLHILFQAKYELCRSSRIPYLKYSQAVERALEVGPPGLRRFSKLSHYLVDSCSILCQLTILCIFASMALSLAPVVDDLLRNWLSCTIDISILFSVSMIPLILSVLMKDIKIVAYLSMFGTALLLTSLGIFIGFLLQDPTPMGNFEMVDLDIKTLPIYVSTLVFSFEAVTVITNFDNNLVSPRTFSRPCGILTLVIFLIMIIQCITGLMVYWRFDNDALTISTIPIFFVTNDILVVCTAFYLVNTYISYGVHEHIFLEIIWSKIERKGKCTKFLVGSLPIIVAGFYVAAKTYTESLLPDCILTLVAGTTISILGIILPALMDISLKWPNNFRRAKLIYYKNIFLVCFGLLSMLCATVYCFLPSNF